MAGDNSSSKPAGGIPAWQRTHKTASSEAPDTKEQPKQEESPMHYVDAEDNNPSSGQAHAAVSSPTSQEELIIQAARFLQDDRITHEPDEKKIEFLESKGLQREDIDRALELSKSARFPTPTTDTTPPPLPANSPSTNPHTPLTPRDVAQPSKPDTAFSTTQKPDVPPIITYPEFLVHSQKPPPIITANRLLNTAYAATGIFAAIYGASKYLIQPMSDSLTHSRHEFHEHALERVEALNAKLGEAISVDPSEVPPRHHRDPMAMAFVAVEEKRDNDDNASEDSDPTELFHRDFGTQTTEELEKTQRRAESTSSSSGDDEGDLDESGVGSETRKLARLKSLVSDIEIVAAMEMETAAETSTLMRMLSAYLDSMAYPMGTYSNNAIYGGTAFVRKSGSNTGSGKKGKDKDNDETGRMKAEIRALKGMLLSARNFPGAAANTSAVMSNGVGGGARAAAFPPVQTGGS